MKRSVFVLLMSMALTFTAVGSNVLVATAAEETASTEEIKLEDLVGSYTAIAAQYSGYYVDPEALGTTPTLEIREDGTGTLAYSGDEDKEEVTVEIEDDHLVFKDGMMAYVSFYDSDVIDFYIMYNTALVFLKDGAEMPDLKIYSVDDVVEVSEGIANWDAESQAMILEKYGLKNDENHLVINNNGIITCYDAEKNVTYYYAPSPSEKEAERLKVQYTRTDLYDSVEVDDNVVVITETDSNVDIEQLREYMGQLMIENE